MKYPLSSAALGASLLSGQAVFAQQPVEDANAQRVLSTATQATKDALQLRALTVQPAENSEAEQVVVQAANRLLDRPVTAEELREFRTMYVAQNRELQLQVAALQAELQQRHADEDSIKTYILDTIGGSVGPLLGFFVAWIVLRRKQNKGIEKLVTRKQNNMMAESLVTIAPHEQFTLLLGNSRIKHLKEIFTQDDDLGLIKTLEEAAKKTTERRYLLRFEDDEKADGVYNRIKSTFYEATQLFSTWQQQLEDQGYPVETQALRIFLYFQPSFDDDGNLVGDNHVRHRTNERVRILKLSEPTCKRLEDTCTKKDVGELQAQGVISTSDLEDPTVQEALRLLRNSGKDTLNKLANSNKETMHAMADFDDDKGEIKVPRKTDMRRLAVIAQAIRAIKQNEPHTLFVIPRIDSLIVQSLRCQSEGGNINLEALFAATSSL